MNLCTSNEAILLIIVYFYTAPTPPTYDDAFAGTEIVQRYDEAARLPVHQ
jgi:hypothetical protein